MKRVFIEPLVRAGVLPRDARLCAFSLTGYSGGGALALLPQGNRPLVSRLAQAKGMIPSE